MGEETRTAETPAETPAEPDTPPPARTIPYSRFEEVYQKMIDYRAKAARLDEVSSELATTRETLSALEVRHDEDRALWGSGLTDPEGQDVARFLWGKLENKPQGGISEWLGSLGPGDGQTPAPRALEPYLGAPPTPPTPPMANGGTVPGPHPSGAVISADQIRGVRERAVQTGDWSEYDKLRPAIFASLSAGR